MFHPNKGKTLEGCASDNRVMAKTNELTAYYRKIREFGLASKTVTDADAKLTTDLPAPCTLR